jgi:hypothetical protein
MEEGKDFDQLSNGLSDKKVSSFIENSWKSRFVDYTDMGDVNLATVPFTRFYREAPGRVKEYLSEKLKGKPLIDLGSGTQDRLTAKYFVKKFGISKYIGVDIESIEQKTSIDNVPVEHVQKEALDFISTYEGQANIMSNGFLCSELVSDKTGYGNIYNSRIFAQIKRILPQDGIFFATHFDLNETAKKLGLKVENEIQPEDGDYWTFISFRK